jgi:hypothetical protein
LAGLFILSITIAAPGSEPGVVDGVAQQTIAFLR